MGNIVGIDLGTTNSLAAFKMAEIEIVTAEDNAPPDRKLTRSVVALNKQQFVVGQQAYNQLRADPENVIFSIKRLMGRGFTDSEVQEQRSRFSYRITKPTHSTENSLSVWLGDQEYQPEDISAQILKKVVQNTQAFQSHLGQIGEISEAVITIPAYFNDKQRNATRIAAMRAGLNPRTLLPEPTAAAISYGFTPDESSDVKTILVYDFGGGTFDVSLITASGNQFIELGKAGNLWLGGDDIDNEIVQFVKTQVAQQEDLTDIEQWVDQMQPIQRMRFLADLKIAVEQTKIALNQTDSVRITPPTPLLNDLQMPVFIDVELTRQQFEDLITPLVERTIPICHDAIRYSEYAVEGVDVVLLVGGSSQIPLVQQKVRDTFGADKVVVHPRPMYAVAEGAAIVAAGLTENIGTVSRDYYIRLVDQDYKVISRGEILPYTTLQTVKTVADGQRLVCLEFFNRDDELEVMEAIGKMWLPLRKNYSKGTEIMVTLELDEHVGYLQISAVLKNDPTVKVSSSFSRGGTDEKLNEDIEQMIQDINTRQYEKDWVDGFSQKVGQIVELINGSVDQRTGNERKDLSERAREQYQALKKSTSEERMLTEFWVYECEFLVQTYRFLVPAHQQERLLALAQDLRNALASENVSGMQMGVEEVRREMANLPREIQNIQACRDAIYIANRMSPQQGGQMEDLKEAMVAASREGNRQEADKNWQKLLPLVQHWLQQKVQKGEMLVDVKL